MMRLGLRMAACCTRKQGIRMIFEFCFCFFLIFRQTDIGSVFYMQSCSSGPACKH